MTLSAKTKNHFSRRKFYRENAVDPHYLHDCPVQKLSWPTKAEAKCCAAKAFKFDGSVLRAYKCQFCKLWHLTSQEKR